MVDASGTTKLTYRRGGALETDDALGIGGLLIDLHRLARLIRRGATSEVPLLGRLLSAACFSLDAFDEDALSAPAQVRLGFRELGLAIGLHAVERARDLGEMHASFAEPLAVLLARAPLAARIAAFWSKPGNRRVAAWTEHQHINDVMLATSLDPDGYLGT